MATASVLPSRKLIYANLNVTEREGSGNPSTNKSTIDWNVTITKGTKPSNPSWTGWGKKIYATIDIDGLGSKTIYIPEYNYEGRHLPGSVFASGSFEISHNADGSKVVNFGISFTDKANGNNDGKYYTPGNGSRVAGTLTCNVIPRYASITSFSVSKRDETSVQFNYGVSVPCDYVWYSKDNGSNWYVLPSNGIVSELSVGTGYNFKLRVRRTDSQLTTDSGTVYQETYGYPSINSAPNFTIGNQLTIGIYNPCNRNVIVYIKDPLYSEKGGDATTGTSITGYNTQSWKEFLYNGIPDSQSGQYRVRLYCEYWDRDTTVDGGNYSVVGNEYPNFSSSNIINVRDTLHTAITGDGSKFIEGHNTLAGTITPMSSSYGANLDYYSISANGIVGQTKYYSSSNIDFTIDNITTNQIKINAVDKRGLPKEATKDITIVPYSVPTLDIINITREGGVGDHIYLNVGGKYTNWSGLRESNSIQTLKYRYKSQSSPRWSSWKTTTGTVSSNGNWSINKLLDDTFTNTQRYDLELQVTDLLETVTFTGLIVSTANALIWRDLANKRIGINKKPDEALDVLGNVKASGTANIGGDATIGGNATVSGTVNGYTLDNVCELGYTVVDTW